jgi:hypothetical protein
VIEQPSAIRVLLRRQEPFRGPVRVGLAEVGTVVDGHGLGWIHGPMSMSGVWVEE